ncbi:hypothetical protein [Vibrio hyugaensis]|uniref:hypothetical protein n=1 Tax=Vibrio hyugaensis TaxID=1534743 RepID=UPI000CE359C2|nr:hypothetical protein [Vibrio hyugaensis]
MLDEKEVEKSYEDACITLDLVENFSGLVIDKLKGWANKEIFDGGLEVEIPLNDAVNAGAVSFPDNPKKAKIIITMGMLFEIYRDSMVFPIYAEKLKRDTDTFSDHLWRRFDSVPFKFAGGVPDLEDNELTAIGQLLVSAWKSANTKMAGVNEEREQMLSRSLACRFQMFEFMIAWVFFHELSHIVQCHYKLKPGQNGNGELYELNSDSLGSYSSQAREILADIEGLDLTLRYLSREGVYNYKSFYFMLCAQTCMFNRFYSGKYDENYFSVKTTHPHPVARYEFVCHYFSSRLNNEVPLVFNDEYRMQKVIEIVYITTKSSIVSNLFWANRHESYEGGELTSFMKVQKKSETFVGKLYQKTIERNINSQLPTILENHLYSDSDMFNLESMGILRKN